jgi:dipeptidase E
MKKIIIASTSALFGERYLEYLIPYLRSHFESVDRLLFIPYARPKGISYDAYTQQVKEGFKELPLAVSGIHEFDDARTAIDHAQAIFVGGGNTFVLMDTLIKQDLLQRLRLVVEKGAPYLGTSAGSNIVGPNVKTTNDMPIVFPASLDSLNLVPFNLNPHYLDPDPGSTHKGETRETRIKEFHAYNSEMVVGLREGSWITVKGEEMILQGNHTARIFQKDKLPFELKSGSDLMTLY